MSIREESRTPVTPQKQVSPTRGWLGVAAITASLFVFLTTELMPIGLLTPLSQSLGVSVGAAGLMVTAQASRPVSACRSSWHGPAASTGAGC